jgi:UPF0755 protein
MRRVALFVFFVALVAGLAGAALVRDWLETPLATGDTPVTVEIPRGQPLSVTARKLAEQGWLEHPRWLAIYARVTRADARVRAGEYSIAPGTTPAALLRQFASGVVVQHSITIVEGWTFRELRAALAHESRLRQTLRGKNDDTVMRELGEPDSRPEGLFFPDTYSFLKGTADLEILHEARERMRHELDAAWEERASDLPLASPYDALILASIVEKETALAAERSRIAGVFTERLRRGMRLQTDPTVIYGLGAKFDGNLRRSDLEQDGPYNTYTRAGLPPTPIALPGAGSLRAATRPEERGELFFVATGRGDGSHTFSKTNAEHERAVAEFLARLRGQREGSSE